MQVFHKKQKGSLLVEVLVGTSIFLLTVLSLHDVLTLFLKASRYTLPFVKGGLLIDEGIEAVRSLRDQSWVNTVGTSTSGTFYLSWASSTARWQMQIPTVGKAVPFITERYERSFTISSVNRDDTTKDIVSSGGALDSGTKKITMQVAWKNGNATTTKQTSFYLTDLFAN